MKREDKLLLALGYCAIPEVRELMLSLGDEVKDFVPKLLQIITERSTKLGFPDPQQHIYKVTDNGKSTVYAVVTLAKFLNTEFRDDLDGAKIGNNAYGGGSDWEEQTNWPHKLLSLLPLRLVRPYSNPQLSDAWWKESAKVWKGHSFRNFRGTLYRHAGIVGLMEDEPLSNPLKSIDVDVPNLVENLYWYWPTELDKGSLTDLLTYVRGCSMMVEGDVYIVIKEPQAYREFPKNYKFIDMFK